MGAFLEQYGIAIFVLVIIGIMVLMGSGLGHTVEGLITQEIKRFTDKSVSENTKVINNKKSVGNTDPIKTSINFNTDNLYDFSNGEVIVNYTSETKDKFFDEKVLDRECGYDGNWYKVSNEVLNGAPLYAEITGMGNSYSGKLITMEDKTNILMHVLTNNNAMVFVFIEVLEDNTFAFSNPTPGYTGYLDKGLYLYDVADTLSDVKITKGIAKVQTKTIQGVSCIQVCKDTYSSPDQLIGKTITGTISGIEDGATFTETVNMQITEDLISEFDDVFTVMNFMVVDETGIYLPIELSAIFTDIQLEIQ